MSLQTQPPLRMLHAITDCLLRVQEAIRPVHGLQKEVAKLKVNVFFRLHSLLRKDQFQFVSGTLHKGRACFRTDADPIQAPWSFLRAVGLYRNFKTLRMERFDQRLIELEQRLTAGADDESPCALLMLRPRGRDRIGK